MQGVGDGAAHGANEPTVQRLHMAVKLAADGAMFSQWSQVKSPGHIDVTTASG